jgi:hypothetical protein
VLKDIELPQNLWIVLVIVITIVVVVQLTFDGLVLAIGSFTVWALSAGHIKIGVRRNLWKPPPKLNGGQVFYYENSTTYMYQNAVALVGLVVVLSGLTAIFGYGMWTNSP